MQNNIKKKSEKIHFDLPEDDYSGFGVESLWAVESEKGLFTIDNIPMFVRDISLGDIVASKKIDGSLFYDKTIKLSSNSVLRVFMQDADRLKELLAFLEKQGCKTETGHIKELVAVSVPSNASINKIIEYLQKGEDKSLWEYEEGSIRY